MAPTFFATQLKLLRSHYGRPPAPISREPFELILWEQVAYLASDPQRHKAFRALRTCVGLRPADILGAPTAQLTAIARLGGPIAAPDRAARMRQSAELVVERWKGNLLGVLRLPVPEARRALARFPMIGEPGADRILAIAGVVRLIPLDSNGLRVLHRLGTAREGKDYRRSYLQAQEALTHLLPRTRAACLEASSLLRQHGQDLCRRSAPQCSRCPLRSTCAFAQGSPPMLRKQI